MTSSRNTLIICGTIMFVAVIGGALGVLHFLRDPESSLTLITILVALLAPTIGSLASLLKADNAKQAAESVTNTVDSVKKDTTALRNGEMEEKIKRIVAQALIDHSIETHPDSPPRSSKVTKR